MAKLMEPPVNISHSVTALCLCESWTAYLLKLFYTLSDIRHETFSAVGVAVFMGYSPMFRRFYIPKVLCSEGSIFRRFYIPKVLYSEI